MRARAACLALVLATSCAGTSGPAAAPPTQGAPVAPAAAPGWKIPRENVNGRSIYALPELEGPARDLVEQLAGVVPGRPPRVAFYYFTLDGRPHHLGESIAQDLATLMARASAGRLEVFSRRKLTLVLEEQGFHVAGSLEDATVVKAGKVCGVDAIVAGRLSLRRGEELRVNIQVLEVERAKLLGAKRVTIPLADVETGRPIEDRNAAAERVGRELGDGLPPDQKWAIAPYPLTRSRERCEFGDDFVEDLASVVQELARPHLQCLTRSFLSAVKAERSEQARSAIYDEATVVKRARDVGGNAVLTGYVELFRDLYQVNVQVIEVETARIRTGSFALVKR